MKTAAVKAAKKELIDYKNEKQRLFIMKLELSAINNEIYSPRGANMNAVPVHTGENHHEERIINAISDPKRESLIREISEMEREHKLIEAGISGLSAISRKTIREFYDNHEYTLIRLAHEVGYSLRTLERIRHNALMEYARLRGLDGGKLAESWRK